MGCQVGKDGYYLGRCAIFLSPRASGFGLKTPLVNCKPVYSTAIN